MLWQDPDLNLALFKNKVGAHKSSPFSQNPVYKLPQLTNHQLDQQA